MNAPRGDFERARRGELYVSASENLNKFKDLVLDQIDPIRFPFHPHSAPLCGVSCVPQKS
jgi:hypothetical protein